MKPTKTLKPSSRRPTPRKPSGAKAVVLTFMAIAMGASCAISFISGKPTVFFSAEYDGFRISIHGPDVGQTLGKCVSKPVTHYNITIQSSDLSKPGRFQNALNIHVGAWKNEQGKLCLVIWESKEGKCWKTCFADPRDFRRKLDDKLREVLPQVLGAFGIVLSVAVIAAMATVLANLLAGAILVAA